MKSSDSTVAKAHHPDMEQPQTGQVTLLVLAGRLPTRGKLGKENQRRRRMYWAPGPLGPWRLTAVQRITRHEKTNEEEEEEELLLSFLHKWYLILLNLAIIALYQYEMNEI